MSGAARSVPCGICTLVNQENALQASRMVTNQRNSRQLERFHCVIPNCISMEIQGGLQVGGWQRIDNKT